MLIMHNISILISFQKLSQLDCFFAATLFQSTICGIKDNSTFARTN